MPIWFELLVLLLGTYAIGLLIGWGIWGRGSVVEVAEMDDFEEETTL